MNFILVILTALFQIIFRKKKQEYFYHPVVGITMADGGEKIK